MFLTEEEAQDLRDKAKKAGLSEAGLIRLLLKGYRPREKPDERFYAAMRELSAIGNRINQIAIKANALGFIDSRGLKKELSELQQLRRDLQQEFLQPEKSDLKWQ